MIRILSRSHIGHSLYRFANKYRDTLQQGPMLVEFWKHCLNLVQFRTIDAECMRVVMEVVKGGMNEWSSVRRSTWGMGLTGPHVLDEEVKGLPSPPPMRGRRRKNGRFGKAETVVVSEEPVVQEQGIRAAVGGICVRHGTCHGTWDRSLMVRCARDECDTRWFHRKCVGAERWAKEWLCPTCNDIENAMSED